MARLPGGDFHSRSAVLDLLFHPRERAYTVPELHTFLRGGGMQLVVFDVSAGLRQLFDEEQRQQQQQQQNEEDDKSEEGHVVVGLAGAKAGRDNGEEEDGDDGLTLELRAWHAFEQRHPGAFGGMYQFWAKAVEE